MHDEIANNIQNMLRESGLLAYIHDVVEEASQVSTDYYLCASLVCVLLHVFVFSGLLYFGCTYMCFEQETK